MATESWEAIIVGGGPAGLQAALILGRSRRRVLLFNSGEPRNYHSRKLSGFLTRDGVPPREFLAEAVRQVERYPSVELREGHVAAVERDGDKFVCRLQDGSRHSARKILLATGLGDEIPQQPGFQDLLGSAIYTCPYCDGWECGDKPVAVYSGKENGPDFALEMSCWTQDVVLLTDGVPLTEEDATRLKHYGVPVRSEKILRLEHQDGHLRRVIFERGEPLERYAIFLATHQMQRGGCLAEQLGAEFGPEPESSNVPGLYAAGDTNGGLQMVIAAAADGARAGVAINTQLLKERLHSCPVRS